MDLNLLIEGMSGTTIGERMAQTQLVLLAELNENVKSLVEALIRIEEPMEELIEELQEEDVVEVIEPKKKRKSKNKA